jgi:two-component system response regulator AtoC
MRAIEQALADIAPTDIPVLLVGESGSGKDSLAVHLHRLSRRSKAPFLKLSCAVLTLETLRGLTNGTAGGNGNGREAHAGTLFLDEICDLDPACQPRLLSLLPDGVSEADGNIGQGVRERLICATSRNLEEQLRAGRFREELYFRINGVCLRVPPLRHRREDILPLLDFFLEKHAAELARPKPSMSSRTLQVTLAHAWPGNLRELENFARKIVAFGDDRAAAAELGNGHELLSPAPQNGGSVSLKEAGRAASRQAEKELILKALARTRWNRKRAAQELQISYKALLYKLKEIGLDESSNGSPKKES